MSTTLLQCNASLTLSWRPLFPSAGSVFLITAWVISCCRMFHLFFWSFSPEGCSVHFPVPSGKLIIRKHGGQMVHKVLKSRCLEDAHSSGLYELTSKATVLDIVAVDPVGRMEPDTSSLVSRHPWPCLHATAVLQKVCEGSKGIGARCEECWQMMAQQSAGGLFYPRTCGRLFWLHHSGSGAPLHAPPMLPSLKGLLLGLWDPAQLFFASLIEKPGRFTGSLTFARWEEQEYEHIIRLHLMSLI